MDMLKKSVNGSHDVKIAFCHLTASKIIQSNIATHVWLYHPVFGTFMIFSFYKILER